VLERRPVTIGNPLEPAGPLEGVAHARHEFYRPLVVVSADENCGPLLEIIEGRLIFPEQAERSTLRLDKPRHASQWFCVPPCHGDLVRIYRMRETGRRIRSAVAGSRW
jgi:hypothetical protein